MNIDEINKIIEAAKKTGAKVEVVGLPQRIMDGINMDDGEERSKHRLSPEAQEANLVSMWAAFSPERKFKPGDILREAPGMTSFSDNPVLLFVRYLDDTYHDKTLLREFMAHRPGYSKVDCVIARVTDEGNSFFLPHSSNQLIPYVPE